MLITVKTLPWYETYPETTIDQTHSFYITPDSSRFLCRDQPRSLAYSRLSNESSCLSEAWDQAQQPFFRASSLSAQWVTLITFDRVLRPTGEEAEQGQKNPSP